MNKQATVQLKTKHEKNKPINKITLKKVLPEKIPELVISTPVLSAKKKEILKPSNIYPTKKIDSVAQSMVDQVESFITKELKIDGGIEIILAVSGGVDSMVMLDILSRLCNKMCFSFIVAHYNHRLRKEQSNDDEKFVRQAAEDYGLRFNTSKGRVSHYAEKNGLSIEHAGRILRYLFLERVARESKSSLVATAHNADDSAETMLFNLFRGSGLTGLSGIPSKRELSRNVNIIRPLLILKKSQIRDYAGRCSIKYHEDETNVLTQFMRNKIRNDLLPKLAEDYNPAIIDTLNRTAKLIKSADEYLSSIIDNALQSIAIDKSISRFSLKVSSLATYNEFLQGEIIQMGLEKYLNAMPVSLAAIDRILNLLHSEAGSVCEIGSSLFALRDRRAIIFYREMSAEKINMEITKTGTFLFADYRLELKEVDKKDIEFNDNPHVEFFDYETVPARLIIRNWKPGDSFTPIGMDGRIKVSDYLINKKIPLIDKKNICVLASKSDIIWLCGHRASDSNKVTKLTSKYLRAELKYTAKQK
ncbi:MAG: tRNA(Ile)-lysidine synthase [Ignavibacteria bacterium]|nr:tRNA(Ile)-lysidine synthase [Ignavibacteria bacterium]